MPSGPADRRSIERSQPPIERIDDIIILPDEKKSGFVQTTTITTEGGVHVRGIFLIIILITTSQSILHFSRIIHSLQKDGQSIPLIKETITTTRRGADEEVIRSGEERYVLEFYLERKKIPNYQIFRSMSAATVREIVPEVKVQN